MSFHRRRRGMGDILNPTAGTSLDCGLFAGGVFKPECWCASFPSLCSSDSYVATQALKDPVGTYAPVLAPPPPPAPTGDALTVPPASGAQAQQTVNDILAQQSAEWKAQNQATMNQTAANLNQIADGQPASVNWLLWGTIALAGVIGLAAIGGGGPRRYGR